MYKDDKVFGSSQYGFMKEKLHLTKTLYKEMTSSVDERRAVNVFIINNAFDTVCHNILIFKLMKYTLDKWTVNWIEK